MAQPLILKNPHSVLAVLKNRPEDVLEIRVNPSKNPSDPGVDPWARVLDLAKSKKIKIQSSLGSKPTHAVKGQNKKPGSRDDEAGRVSQTHAIVKERDSVTAEELFRNAKERANGKGIWLALDSLQDPQNVGAIFRTAAFFGIEGILITQERSAPLSSAVYDIASGGMESVPFCEQINLQRAFEIAKKEGLWILGTSEHAQQSIAQTERDRPWLVVVGNEEKGMRRLTEEACDVVCTIPGGGEVTSLNVSVATGIILSALQFKG